MTILVAAVCFADEAGNQDLAAKAQNPIADLISLPFQNNTNFGIGRYDRTQNVLNIQPVYPFNRGRWNVITRTILPVVYQPYIDKEEGGKFGLSDLTTTWFLSPAEESKVTWGVGPVLVFPTATDDILGSGKWSAGAGVVVLTTPSPWVIGVLVQNWWSFAGDSERSSVNSMLIQYFINYNYEGGWYVTSAPIITANWEASSGNKWLIPFGVGVGKVFSAGKQPLNCSAHYYHNTIHPDTAPYANWTLRLQLQFLFPK
jgi:hypothetical protein